MTKNTLTFAICILIFNYAFAQDNFIEGSVFDNNNKGVEFAHIFIQKAKLGIITNENGVFKIENHILQENINDTLIFSCIGFYKKQITVKEFYNNPKKTVQLQQNIIEFDEIVITPNRANKEYILGYYNYRSSPMNIYGSIGKCVVVQIKSNNIKDGIIKSIVVKLSKSQKDNDEKLRVRFFEQQNNTLIPIDFFNGELVLISDFSKKKIEVNIQKYNIPLSSKGIFVGLEWLEKENKIKNVDDTDFIGIKCTSKVSENNTWLIDSYDMSAKLLQDKISNEDKQDIPKFLLRIMQNANAQIGIKIIEN